MRSAIALLVFGVAACSELFFMRGGNIEQVDPMTGNVSASMPLLGLKGWTLLSNGGDAAGDIRTRSMYFMSQQTGNSGSLPPHLLAVSVDTGVVRIVANLSKAFNSTFDESFAWHVFVRAKHANFTDVLVLGKHLDDPASPLTSTVSWPIVQVSDAWPLSDDARLEQVGSFPGGWSGGNGVAPTPVDGAFDTKRAILTVLGTVQRQYHVTKVGVVSIMLSASSPSSKVVGNVSLGIELSYIGYTGPEHDSFYGFGTCLSPKGGASLPTECKGKEGNFTLVTAAAGSAGVASLAVQRVITAPLLPGMGNRHTSIGTSGTIDQQRQRLTMFTVIGSAPPHRGGSSSWGDTKNGSQLQQPPTLGICVMSTFDVVTGQLLVSRYIGPIIHRAYRHRPV
jgi:hypothetical protein